MRTPREALSGFVDGSARWLDRIAEDGLVRMVWWRVKAWFGHRMVARKLVPGERVIAEVKHMGLLYVVPGLIALVGLVLVVRWLPFVSADAAWFAVALVVGLLGYAFYRALLISRDRFVITDSRVFRVWGVFTLNEGEMEIVRVLDIAVVRPWYLRPFGAGHIILENAAQEQGLREIHYIPDPQTIAMAIHRRRRTMMGLGGDEESGTPPSAGSGGTRTGRRRADHPRSPGPITARRRP
ncbi:MAG: PH domain-containing protein [Jiangellaceae bacterium]